jgi:hypothetical protein
MYCTLEWEQGGGHRGCFLVRFFHLFLVFWANVFLAHCNVIPVKESKSGQQIRLLDAARSYILYCNGEVNTMRVIGVTLNIY